MENQINIDNQSTQEIRQNPVNKSAPILEKPRLNYWMVSIIIFTVFSFIGIGTSFLISKQVKKSQIFPTPVKQTTNTISTATTTISAGKQEAPQGGEIYQNNQLNISFNYPSDWLVTEENDVSKQDLCDLYSIDPDRYPHPFVKYGDCGGTGITPTTSITSSVVLNIRPKSSLQESNHPMRAIELFYYENGENLSIQEFNNKYLSSPSVDPVSIWDPTYEKITNSNKINAYYDKEHYCTSICQIYVWSRSSKIFILQNFPARAADQDLIFHQVFNSFKFIE